MPIDLLIFDWSGTISDDRHPVYEADMAILRKYGKPTASFEEWIGFQAPFRSTLGFLQFHGIEDDDEYLKGIFRDAYLAAVHNGSRPQIYPGARETLMHLMLRNKKIAVVSSHPLKYLTEEAEEYGVSRFIQHLRGDANDKVPAIKEVCRTFGCPPESVGYVGDTVHDIRDTKRAGAVSVAVLGGYHDML